MLFHVACRSIFDAFDQDWDGTLTRSELLQGLAQQVGPTDTSTASASIVWFRPRTLQRYSSGQYCLTRVQGFPGLDGTDAFESLWEACDKAGRGGDGSAGGSGKTMDLIGAADGEAPTNMGKHEYFITFDGE